MKNRRIEFICAIFLQLLFCSCSPAFSNRPVPYVMEGVLDLSDWNFETHGPVKLDGQWELYWERFLERKDVMDKAIAPGGLIAVPGSWNGFDTGETLVDGPGYATYRLRIRLPNGHRRLGLRVPAIGTAYRLTMNGEVLADAGTVGVSPASTEGALRIVYAAFESQREVDLLIQVANFDHRRGGLWRPLHLGLEDQIRDMQLQALGVDLFLAGAIFIMGLYQLAQYRFRRQDPAGLWLGLFCLIIVFRLLSTGERLLYNMVPGFTFDLIFVQYLTYYASIPVFALFIQRLFPDSFPSRLLLGIVPLGLVFTLVVLAAPPMWYTQTLNAFRVYTILFALAMLSVSVRAMLRGNPEAGIFLGAFAVIFASYLSDVATTELGLSLPYVFPLGVFIFIFAQNVILSRRNDRYVRRVSEESADLERRMELQKEDLRQARDEVVKLNEFTRLMNEVSGKEQILDLVFAYIQSTFHAEVIWLLRIDAASNELYTSRAFHANWDERSGSRVFAENFRAKISPELGGFWEAIQRRRPLYVTRTVGDGRQNAFGVKLVDLNSILYVPLLLGERVIGVVSITNSSTPLKLTEEQIRSIDRFCQQITGALYQASLREEVAQVRAEIQKLNDFSRELNEAESIEDLTSTVCAHLEREFELDIIWLLLVDPESREVYCGGYYLSSEAARYLDAVAIRRFATQFRERLDPELGAIFRAYRSQRPMYVTEVKPHRPGLSAIEREIVALTDLKESLQLPLVTQGGTIGIVSCARSRPTQALGREKIRTIWRFCDRITGAAQQHRARTPVLATRGPAVAEETLPGTARRSRASLLNQLYRTLY